MRELTCKDLNVLFFFVDFVRLFFGEEKERKKKGKEKRKEEVPYPLFLKKNSISKHKKKSDEKKNMRSEKKNYCLYL